MFVFLRLEENLDRRKLLKYIFKNSKIVLFKLLIFKIFQKEGTYVHV